MIGSLILAFLALPLVCALYSSKDEVVELNSKTFSQVLQSPHLWIVEFYAPWCGHCKNFAPEYKAAAKNLKNFVKVGAVDCDEDSNKAICGQYGIKGFPTVKVFVSDRTGKDKFTIDYNGERNAKKLKEYALDKISDKNIRKLKKNSANTLEKFFDEHNTTTAKVLLFSKAKSTSHLYKVLSLEFKGKLMFAEVGGSEKEYAETFGVTSYPSLFVVPVDGEPVLYERPIKYDDLLSFLGKFLSKSNTEGSKQGREKPPLNLEIPLITSPRDIDNSCLQPTRISRSSVCLISILPPLETEYEESVKQRNDFMQVLKGLKKQWYVNQEKDVLPNVYFVAVDGLSEYASRIITKFGLSSDFPAVVLVNPNFKAYRPLLGAFEISSLYKFIRETASSSSGKAFAYDWLFDVENEDISATPPETSNHVCTGSKEGKVCKGPPKDSFSHDEL